MHAGPRGMAVRYRCHAGSGCRKAATTAPHIESRTVRPSSRCRPAPLGLRFPNPALRALPAGVGGDPVVIGPPGSAPTAAQGARPVRGMETRFRVTKYSLQTLGVAATDAATVDPGVGATAAPQPRCAGCAGLDRPGQAAVPGCRGLATCDQLDRWMRDVITINGKCLSGQADSGLPQLSIYPLFSNRRLVFDPVADPGPGSWGIPDGISGRGFG